MLLVRRPDWLHTAAADLTPADDNEAVLQRWKALLKALDYSLRDEKIGRQGVW
ncbi:hypothetical protein [Streptomyces swartbergensis]|uniref:hypothetical protein n=1 Tax=Streptomyces swartbergensis TaxID=487165 RepID=UPI00130266A7|nr:hypothetical protein [Streptomyces swartbergensis]